MQRFGQMLAASSACGNFRSACGNSESAAAISNACRKSRSASSRRPISISAALLLLSSFLATSLLAAPALAQSLTIVHSFSGSDGSAPTAGLLLASDQNFYGTTMQGGAHSLGTVFKLTPAGALTTLHSFDQSDGAAPAASLIQGSDGALYGTTSSGGAHNNGTVYRITTSGDFSTLHTFTGLDGSNPYGPLLAGADGNFYGTTAGGGSQFSGTVFQLTPAGALTVLHNFAGQDGPNGEPGNDGSFPYGSLISLGNGYVAGTTGRGGVADNLGVIFTVDTAGVITEPILFDRTDGSDAFGGLILATDGNAYGLTRSGGTAGGFGVLYEFNLHQTPQSSALSVLSNFAGGGQPFCAYGALLQASDGNFYGTSNSDSNYGDGTVFEFEPASGTLTVLVTFTGPNGSFPYSTLVQGSGGTLWGTTSAGGAYGLGEIFKTTVSSLASRPVAHPATRHPAANLVRADPLSAP